MIPTMMRTFLAPPFFGWGASRDSLISAQDLEPEILDHRVAEELLAHGAELLLGGGLVAAVDLELDQLADPRALDGAEAERPEGAADRVALRVEDLFLERDVDVGLHGI